MKVIRISLLIAICTLTSAFAIAYGVTPIPFGWYIDGNVGISKISNTDDRSGTSINNSGTGFNVDVGYKFMPYLGAEIGYSDYSDAKIKISTGTEAGKVQNSAYDIAIKGILPVIDTAFEFFAKVGAAQVKSEVTIDHKAAALLANLKKGTHTATSFFIGVGADYSFIPNVPINIQWQRAMAIGLPAELIYIQLV